MSTGPVGSRVSSSISAALLEYLATSSMATARPRMPPPAPPYSVGITRPRSPASRKISNRSWGYSLDSSISRARGLTLSWARRRTLCCSSASSGDSSKFTTGTLDCAAVGAVDDWESQGAYHDLRGRRVFVLDRAAERARRAPMLVLHGFPSCSFDWRHVVDAFAREHRVVLVDLLGY